MKRLVDLLFSLLAVVLLAPIFLFVAIGIWISSPGPILHWSKRIGLNNAVFLMPKFRTMKVDTPDVATHLLAEPEQYYTVLGRLLRKTSIDELPQLFSVIGGNMSLVGPRPALHNQEDLIDLRTRVGIHTIKPGITGWAQINGRDELPIPTKVEYDRYYFDNHTLVLDLKILLLTLFRVLQKRGISH